MATINGTNGNDNPLNGTEQDDIINGLDGDDYIYGLGGNDTINGNTGRDVIYGGGGNDTLYSGGDPYAAYVSSEHEGGILYGGEGNDNLYGDNGYNWLNGGIGDDTYYVGSGSNHNIFNNNWGHDTVVALTSTAQMNSLYFEGVTANLFIDVSTFQVVSGDNSVTWDENLYLTNISGGNGNDTIHLIGSMNAGGNGGDDVIYGGDGNNSLNGQYGNDTLFGGLGNDTLNGDGGSDFLYGGDGDDSYTVSSGSDIINDSSGSNDSLGFWFISSVDSILGIEARDSNSDGFVDQLFMNVQSSGNVIIENYFDNTSNDYDLSNGGTGLIEKIKFGNTNYYFSDIIEFMNNVYDVPETPPGSITGTNLIDNINGTESADEIYGFDGNDLVQGLGGDDTIYGGMGEDNIYGNAGHDVINGGSGNDNLYGGDGNDTLIAGIESENSPYNGNGNEGADLYGESGDDVLYGDNGYCWFNGGTGNDIYHISNGRNTLQFENDWGSDTIVMDTTTQSSNSLSFYGYNQSGLTIDTSTTEVTDGTNTVTWNADMVISYVSGGDGNDIIILSGTQTATGNDGDDIIYGGNGNAWLRGENGNDTVYGGDGNNRMWGNYGNDTLYGGAGDDSYLVDQNQEHDIINDSAGTNDSLEPGYTTTFSTVTLFEGRDSDNNGYLDQLYFEIGSNNSFSINNYFSNSILFSGGTGLIENLKFSDTNMSFSDVATILGYSNTTDDFIWGANTSEGIAGFDGNDQIYARLGDDSIYGGNGNDILYGQEGNDVIYGGADNDYIVGGYDNDTLNGDDGDDQLWGQWGGDILNGGAGNDFLDGGFDADTMSGGAGDDMYRVDNVGDVVIESSNQGNDSVYTLVDFTLGSNIENLILMGSGNLNGTGNSINNNITGTAGDNILSGGSGNDNLNGGMGNDTLIGGSGNDYLYGGGNIDTMSGGTGDDSYHVDNVNDVITESTNQGNDTVYATVNHILAANVENLLLQGEGLNLNGTGNALNNNITGTSGNNTLNGGDGNDYISGGAGSDNLIGGNGNDTLYGGTGNDYMTDASGNDVYFRLQAGFGDDIINDSAGVDLVDFSSFNLADATGWTAIDSNGDNGLDRLLIDFNTGDSLLVAYYFNNANIDPALCGAGAGYIEEIRFADTSLDLADVQVLVA